MITNSLGSNYTNADVRHALSLLLHPEKGAREQLQKELASLFKTSPANVSLFFKGRHGLQVALVQSGLRGGDEVILQAFTCAVLPEAILKAGGIPIYVDLSNKKLNPSLSLIIEKVTRKTKGVILQHTLGYVNPENDAIIDWCRQRHITVIQDLAHACGAPELMKSNDSPVILSFSQDKVVDGISGGALITDSKPLTTINSGSIKENQRRLLLYPLITNLIRVTYDFGIGKGIHFLAKLFDLLPSPLDAPQEISDLPEPFMFLALAQLKRLPMILSHRQTISSIYDELIQDKFKIVSRSDVERGANLRYPIWVSNRDALEETLKHDNYYLFDHWYNAPVSPSWRSASSSYREGSCPNAEAMSEHIFNLPTHISISQDKATMLARLVNQYGR